MRQLGPAMMQHFQTKCDGCQGAGHIPPAAEERCPTCKGVCMVVEKRRFDVRIEAGMKTGSRIMIRGEAGCSDPKLAPGDIVIVVEEKSHAVFQRTGVDLIMSKTITLSEALTGCTFLIGHLDGRTLRVAIPAGEVVKPGSFKCLHDEGMPFRGRPHQKGNMYIRFSVEFPDTVTQAQAAGIRAGLSDLLVQDATPAGSDTFGDEADIEDVQSLKTVADVDKEFRSRMRVANSAGQASGLEEEDVAWAGMEPGDDVHHQRVQCAQH